MLNGDPVKFETVDLNVCDGYNNTTGKNILYSEFQCLRFRQDIKSNLLLKSICDIKIFLGTNITLSNRLFHLLPDNEVAGR